MMPIVVGVMLRYRPSPELMRLLFVQEGVINRTQALGLGVPQRTLERLTRDGAWHALAAGIYCDRESPTWMAWAWGALLAGGDSAVLGLEAAGHLHGLLADPPMEIAVWVGARRRRSRQPRWRFVQGERTGMGQPARSTLSDTVLDLCDVAASDDDVVALIGKAANGQPRRQRALASALSSRRAHAHRRLIRDVLGDVAQGAESPLERRFLAGVERAHGLPRGTRQAWVGGSRVDSLYEEFGVIVELDGRRFHSGERSTADRHRDNVHAAHNLVTLRYEWVDVVNDPCRVAAELAHALAARGWPGTPVACRRCPLAR